MLCTAFRNCVPLTKKLPPAAFRIQARLSITSSTTSFRNYAANPAASRSKNLPKSPRIAKPPPQQAPARPSSLRMGQFSQARKIEMAEKLFNSGDKILYQSTRRTTNFRVNAWMLSSLALLGLGYFYSNRLLDINYYREIGHDHPILVCVAFSTTSFFLAAAATWTFKKSLNHVDSIELVQKSSAVFLQVTYRRFIPFLKKSFIIRPSDMVVDGRYVVMMSIPEFLHPNPPSETSPSAFTYGVIRETLKSVSRFFYQIFDSARAFFSQEGIISADMKEVKDGKEKTTEYYMDAGGLYLQQNGKIALWDLVELNEPNLYG